MMMIREERLVGGGEGGGLPFYAASNKFLIEAFSSRTQAHSLSLSLSWPVDASNLVLIMSKRKATSDQGVSYCDR